LFYVPHNYVDDGSRMFFNSEDPLVAHDSNGQLDVYEYEGGRVYPVSDVAGNSPSIFLDASPSGNDVFIGTADQLLPADTDYRVDVYDVRVGGGFPVAGSPPPCGNADSCKGQVSPQPSVFGAPASSTFVGAGNIVATGKPALKAKHKPKQKKRQKRRGKLRRHGAKGKSGVSIARNTGRSRGGRGR
jgi:hypothetical protein